MAEGLPADAAAERSCPAVRPPNVDFQSVGCWEHLKHCDIVKPLVPFHLVKASHQNTDDRLSLTSTVIRYMYRCEAHLPCRRWCSGRCWKWGSSAYCSLKAAEAVRCGWYGCCTGYWHAAALWDWSSSGGVHRRLVPAPRHMWAYSKERTLPCEDLRVHRHKNKGFYVTELKSVSRQGRKRETNIVSSPFR